jgi:phosphatidylinositol alpha-1,6-mannosyltransferase
MRLLYLTPGCFDKGGISRYSRYQIEALRELLGVENVRVLSLLGPDADDFEEPFAVDWHSSARPGRVGLSDRVAFSTRALASAAAWKPNIALAAHVNFAPLLSAAARVSGARTMLNVYGLEVWSGLSPARRSHMARVQQLISDCHFTAEYVAEAGLHRGPVTVIWDPVDLTRFSPGAISRSVLAKYELPDPAHYKLVVSLGRLAKAAAHKGFDRLIETAASLRDEAADLRFVIAGRGDDRPRLEALVASHGLQARVHFTGPIDEADLPDLYRTAYAFSLVSDRGPGRGEGIPLTPLEAMACGAPIFVGDEDGSREAVIDGRNGFVVSPRNPSAHREALLRLARDPSLRGRLSTGARRVAEGHFSFEGFQEKHRRLLDGVAAACPAARGRVAV